MSFTNQEIETYLSFAQRLAGAARQKSLPLFRGDTTVFNKAGVWFDPVTDADREAERVIREMITKMFPDHGVIGEEFGVTDGNGPWRWVLDPVDGTRAFICGLPTWATLIALEYDGAAVLSIIDQPYTDECWIGTPGKTFLHHKGKEMVCQTSGLTDLSKARISTTDPRGGEYFSDEEAAMFIRVSKATRLARFSLDAYAYALIANGQLDLVIETGLHHHDWAALTPVVEGAGGIITNWRGGPISAEENGQVIAAATPELHAAALEVMQSA